MIDSKLVDKKKENIVKLKQKKRNNYQKKCFSEQLIYY